MIYHVKNIVEEIPEMNYNDGIKKIFLYTNGENGGSDELRKLLLYMKHSCVENVTDERLERLHYGVEGIRSNSVIGVKYMQMWEIIELEKQESKAEGKTDGKTESILELLEEIDVIPDSLKQTILSQKDMDILNKWLKLSAKVASIDEFIEKMN